MRARSERAPSRQRGDQQSCPGLSGSRTLRRCRATAPARAEHPRESLRNRASRRRRERQQPRLVLSGQGTLCRSRAPSISAPSRSRRRRSDRGTRPVGSMLNNMAVLYYDQGRYAEAEPLFKRAVAVRQGALGADTLTLARPCTAWPVSTMPRSGSPRLGRLHERALQIRRKAQGPEHPEVIQSLDGIARMYEAQRNWKRPPPPPGRRAILSSAARARVHWRRPPRRWKADAARSRRVARCSPGSCAHYGRWGGSSRAARRAAEGKLSGCALGGADRGQRRLGSDVSPAGERPGSLASLVRERQDSLSAVASPRQAALHIDRDNLPGATSRPSVSYASNWRDRQPSCRH